MAEIPFDRRGETYFAAVERRGGHEFTGGCVEWEPTDRTCPGCTLCGLDVASMIAAAREKGSKR